MRRSSAKITSNDTLRLACNATTYMLIESITLIHTICTKLE